MDASPNGTHQWWAKLRLAEWLTFIIAVGTLLVAVLGYLNSRDTADLKEAVGSLTKLAKESKREADAAEAQMKSMAYQANAADAQLSELRRTADATAQFAASANETAMAAHEQTEISRSAQRPWVTVSDPRIGNLRESERFDQGSTLDIKITSVGQKPALNVSIYSTLALDAEDFEIVQRKICSQQSRTEKTFPPVTIFPGESKVYPSNGISMDNRHFAAFTGSSSFSGGVVGCVIYSDEYGNLHHTSFSYDIRTIEYKHPSELNDIHIDDESDIYGSPSIRFVSNMKGSSRED